MECAKRRRRYPAPGKWPCEPSRSFRKRDSSSRSTRACSAPGRNLKPEHGALHGCLAGETEHRRTIGRLVPVVKMRLHKKVTGVFSTPLAPSQVSFLHHCRKIRPVFRATGVVFATCGPLFSMPQVSFLHHTYLSHPQKLFFTRNGRREVARATQFEHRLNEQICRDTHAKLSRLKIPDYLQAKDLLTDAWMANTSSDFLNILICGRRNARLGCVRTNNFDRAECEEGIKNDTEK